MAAVNEIMLIEDDENNDSGKYHPSKEETIRALEAEIGLIEQEQKKLEERKRMFQQQKDKLRVMEECRLKEIPFNRPNLYYEVIPKPAGRVAALSMMALLLETRFRGESGIIYARTTRNAERLRKDLAKAGLQLGCYDASLDTHGKSEMLRKWIYGEYQALVVSSASAASFDEGLEKPDLRFVIHWNVSKSMENYYRECGRAGGDGTAAEVVCVAFYRLHDIFLLSRAAFWDKVGPQNVYKVLEYCIDTLHCRRSLLAAHFDETWSSSDCAGMCDHCRQPAAQSKVVDVAPYCRQLYQIISKASECGTRASPYRLIDAWCNKSYPTLRDSTIPIPEFPRGTCEAIIGYLLINGYLEEDYDVYGMSTITYLKRGPKAALALDENHAINFVCNASL